MNHDLEIALNTPIIPIGEIAKKAGIEEKYVVYYGDDKAKIKNELMLDLQKKQEGKLVLVTAMNPTSAGEGKSTTTIGLIDGLAKLNQNVMGCLREPSMGPVFGLKGGATGGGKAQVMPMDSINLHFTGDMHAITSSTNLIAAMIDNSIYQGNPLQIDPKQIVWKRCLDVNDRTLRDITIGQKKKVNGVEREDHFCITVATEMMAILCLCQDLKDFEERLGRCIVAYTYDHQPVYVKDLGCVGAVSLLMKDAIMPNLVQTLEHHPVLIHGGPFANIAHGCNSLIATKMALKLADVVVTEAGFGADLGGEKFLDIKSRVGHLNVNCVVIVATIRALKLHGGINESQLDQENMDAIKMGFQNLQKHIETIQTFGLPFVVAINVFDQDHPTEIDQLTQILKQYDYPYALCYGYAQGGDGMVDLAQKVLQYIERPSKMRPIYELTDSIPEKILQITQKVYGGKGVEYSDLAKEKIAQYTKLGYGNLPICMAKTPNSLSDDAKLKGRPENFTIHVQDVSLSLGVGFIVVYTGSIMTMPGLPKQPAALGMGIDEHGKPFGIF